MVNEQYLINKQQFKKISDAQWINQISKNIILKKISDAQVKKVIKLKKQY